MALTLSLLLLALSACGNQTDNVAHQNTVTEQTNAEKQDVKRETVSPDISQAIDFSNITMEPTTSELVGMHTDYAFIPLGDNVYRYSIESVNVTGATKKNLLYECVETTFTGEEYAWRFYALEEYPGFEKILGESEGTFIFAYAKANGKTDSEIEDTMESDIVVLLNGSVVAGKNLWEDFLEEISNEEEASVIIGYLYRDRQEQMSEELWKATREDDPSLFFRKITYDGEKYLSEPVHRIDGEYVVMEEEGYDSPAYEFKYLMHYYGDSPYEFALYTYYDKYVLTDDDTVTWEEIETGMFSSHYGDYIPYEEVYGEYWWKE